MPRSGSIYRLSANTVSVHGKADAVEALGLLLLELGHCNLSILPYRNDTAGLFVPYSEEDIRRAVKWVDNVRRRYRPIQDLGSQLTLEKVDMPDSYVTPFRPTDIRHIQPSICRVDTSLVRAFKRSVEYAARAAHPAERGWFCVTDTVDADFGCAARACGILTSIIQTGSTYLTYLQSNSERVRRLRTLGWRIRPLDRHMIRSYHAKFGAYCINPYPPLHEFDHEEITRTANANKEASG